MSDHPIKRMWETTRDSDRPGPDANPTPDHFREGLDYLSLVSSSEFETFMMLQLANDEVHKRLGFRDVLGWLTSASSNHPSSALRIRDLPEHKLLRFPIFIDKLRQAIWKAISDVILNAHREQLMPESGTLTYFTSDLRYCYIIGYHLHFDRPVIEILDRIENPRGIFEVDEIRRLRTHRARNRAKNYLTSGQKIVVQNGIITHVDRRYDKNVFGPTIDTLWMAHILARMPHKEEVNSFIEIGSGSGHISSTIGALFKSINNFVAIDISEFATSCTVRNVRTNLRYFRSMKLDDFGEFMVAFGRFHDNNFRHSFDLVVSNPPYIPSSTPIPRRLASVIRRRWPAQI